MRRIFLILVLGLAVVSCRRSGGDVWQDTKTSGRYMKRGVQSLAGKHPDSRQVHSAQEFAGMDEEFIPLADEQAYQTIVVGEIDEATAIRQSRLSPGDLGSSIPGVDGFHSPASAELSAIFKRLHFETDQYALRGEGNRKVVRSIVRYLQKHPEVYIFIEGHCDERGAAAYNLALGSRRSNAVRNALIKEGVDLDRLFTISYGKERPIARGHGSDDWNENRRAEFKIYRRS